MRHHTHRFETAVNGESDQAAWERVFPSMLLGDMLFDDESDAFSFTEPHEDVGERDREGSCELRNCGEDICGGLEGWTEGGKQGGKVSLADGHDESFGCDKRLSQERNFERTGRRGKRQIEVLENLETFLACHKASRLN